MALPVKTWTRSSMNTFTVGDITTLVGAMIAPINGLSSYTVLSSNVNAGVDAYVEFQPTSGALFELGTKMVIAGATGAPTPKMAEYTSGSSQAFSADKVLIGVSRNGGTFTTWDDASLYGSQFPGYFWFGLSQTGASRYDQFDFIYHDECIIVSQSRSRWRNFRHTLLQSIFHCNRHQHQHLY